MKASDVPPDWQLCLTTKGFKFYWDMAKGALPLRDEDALLRELEVLKDTIDDEEKKVSRGLWIKHGVPHKCGVRVVACFMYHFSCTEVF